MGNNFNIDSKDYEIIKEKKGKFGIVYKLMKDDKYYTYKRILITSIEKEKIDKYLEEAKILSKIDNEYIVKCYYSFIDQEYFNILLEYTGYSNLRRFINTYKNKNELIDEKIIKDIIIQICLGLKEIYNNNLIHGNLSPVDIFINENNKIKIDDFITLKLLNCNLDYISNNYAKNYYKSPYIKEKENYNNKIDIYSLGCIIYELLTLNNLYNDKFFEAKEIQIDINTYNPRWQKLIEILTEKDYNKRPTIDEVLNFVENIYTKINIDDYKTIKELGHGAFGTVYKLEKDNKYYAYKKILIKNLSKEEINKY
jgi:serine/threonine protein kinase